jgi:hypothetical protein
MINSAKYSAASLPSTPTTEMPSLPGTAWADKSNAVAYAGKNELNQPTISDLRPCKLKYSIYEFSSCNEKYPPHNVLHNRPTDQGSRWTTQFIDQSQFLTIQLEKKAVIKSLVFGKFHKPHVCNLREFRVLAGMTPDKMVEVFHGGLENNTEMETIALSYRTKNGAILPVRFLKIIPHASYQKDFPYSVWYLEVHGIADSHVVDQCYFDFLNWREAEIVRQCLKYFRQRNYTQTFQSLVQETSMVLEDPLLSQLHQLIVNQGAFEASEELILKVAEKGMFHEYISEDSTCPQWSRVVNQSNVAPSARGGHQMFFDVAYENLYLYGGWDGSVDLGDLWEFNLESKLWRCICTNTRDVGGPTPRSCHKSCVDPINHCVYFLGRYMEPLARNGTTEPSSNTSSYDSDFWKYDLVTNTWIVLSNHTANEDGPSLIYDHQMSIDCERQMLYVFGGRVVTADPKVQLYSGLYVYSIVENKWTSIRYAKSSISIFSCLYRSERRIMVLRR